MRVRQGFHIHLGKLSIRVSVSRIVVYLLVILLVLFTSLPLIYVVSTAFKPLDELLRFPPIFFVRKPTKEEEYPAEGTKLSIDIYSISCEGAKPEIKQDAEKGNVLCWREDTKALSSTVEVAQAGFYNLSFSYYPIDGNSLSISRGIKIDGEYPFDEASNFALCRRFVDSDRPKENNLGDDLMPQQEEVKTWLQEKVWDNQGAYGAPLEFYLTVGKHTVTLEYIDQPMLVSEIAFTAASKLPDYKEALSQYKANGAENAKETIRFEAEDFDRIVGKSASSILIASDSDETLTPKATIKKKFNLIGGSSWSTGGDSITWKFEVPKTGLYKIALRSVQNGNNGIPVYRTVEIDGEIPFAQMADYAFPYNARWNTHIIGDGEEPYLFYLILVKMGYIDEKALPHIIDIAADDYNSDFLPAPKCAYRNTVISAPLRNT